MGKLSPNGFAPDWRERLQAQIDTDMRRLAEIRQAKAEASGQSFAKSIASSPRSVTVTFKSAWVSIRSMLREVFGSSSTPEGCASEEVHRSITKKLVIRRLLQNLNILMRYDAEVV